MNFNNADIQRLQHDETFYYEPKKDDRYEPITYSPQYDRVFHTGERVLWGQDAVQGIVRATTDKTMQVYFKSIDKMLFDFDRYGNPIDMDGKFISNDSPLTLDVNFQQRLDVKKAYYDKNKLFLKLKRNGKFNA